jgi:hypothetical protein
MTKIAAALLLALGLSAAQATPIAFTSTSHTTDAFADVGGVFDLASFAAPPDVLPLSAAAAVGTAGGAGTATATADALVLTASTTASSAGDPALASAVATFFGEFLTPGGVLSLSLDYLSAGALGATLDVLWIVDGIVQPLLGPGPYLTGDLAAGLAGTLEIVLTSVVFAELAGDEAVNSSSLAFALDRVVRQAPEPAAPLLLAAGLGLIGLVRRMGPRWAGR